MSSLGVSPYTYNSSNELTALPSGSYTYDNNGNTKTKPDGTQFTWDTENRLTQVVLPGTGGTVNLKYDPFGRRIQKAFTQGSTTTTTNYVYDGINLLEELDNNGNVLGRYTGSGETDENLAVLRSGTTSYYQQDALGSSSSISNSGGGLANTYTYDSYGKLLTSSGSLTNPFQYTGLEFDSETGLYFYRARYFDPTIGRFASEDPIRFDGGINFFAYADNSTPNEVDPFGLSPGGPNNPRVKVRCKASDSCSELRGKILLLERTISSHQGWDWTMPWPRGGSRHSQEISDFWNALARCMSIHDKKCKNRDCDPQPNPQSQPQPQSNPSPGVLPLDPVVPTMPDIPLPEIPLPEPIFVW